MKSHIALLGAFLIAFAGIAALTGARARAFDEQATAASSSLVPVSVWLLNTDGHKGQSPNAAINAVVSQVLSDVGQVSFTDTDVYLRTEGIPTYLVGPFPDGNPSIPTARNHTFRITRNPQPAAGTHTSTPL